MRDAYAILALRRKRAHLAGEIDAAERRLAQRRGALASLDAAILLFDAGSDPTAIRSIRPVRRCLHFRHGEQQRLCLEAVRTAATPLTARQIAEHAMRTKGLDTQDGTLRAVIIEQVRMALRRLVTRGVICRIGGEPCVRWRLPTVAEASGQPRGGD